MMEKRLMTRATDTDSVLSLWARLQAKQSRNSKFEMQYPNPCVRKLTVHKLVMHSEFFKKTKPDYIFLAAAKLA